LFQGAVTLFGSLVKQRVTHVYWLGSLANMLVAAAAVNPAAAVCHKCVCWAPSLCGTISGTLSFHKLLFLAVWCTLGQSLSLRMCALLKLGSLANMLVIAATAILLLLAVTSVCAGLHTPLAQTP
jgi:hypothetical protein